MADTDKPYKYNEFKQYLRFELGMSDNSVISYLQDLESLFKFYKGNLVNINPTDIVSFMSFMRKNNQSIETILRRLSGLSQYYDFLIMLNLYQSLGSGINCLIFLIFLKWKN